jgi:hypothetical protein
MDVHLRLPVIMTPTVHPFPTHGEMFLRDRFSTRFGNPFAICLPPLNNSLAAKPLQANALQISAGLLGSPFSTPIGGFEHGLHGVFRLGIWQPTRLWITSSRRCNRTMVMVSSSGYNLPHYRMPGAHLTITFHYVLISFL